MHDLKWSYDKLTYTGQVFISFEIYETGRTLISDFIGNDHSCGDQSFYMIYLTHL